MNIYEVLRSPRITEKNTQLGVLNKYTFNVAPEATKLEIKQAVEFMFKVHVQTVNTMNRRGDERRVGRWRTLRSRKPSHKKAIVTLRAGEKIEFFEAQ
ncbi:MAG: 50S ribosomal protein L23 [Chloroflexi bacterium]|nr:50S ribosomal protein L23 [Chloroflexota bacterium]